MAGERNLTRLLPPDWPHRYGERRFTDSRFFCDVVSGIPGVEKAKINMGLNIEAGLDAEDI